MTIKQTKCFTLPMIEYEALDAKGDNVIFELVLLIVTLVIVILISSNISRVLLHVLFN